MIRRFLTRRTETQTAEVPLATEAPAIDVEFYRRTYQSVVGTTDPAIHYFSEGARRGFLPSENFDPLVYACTTPGVPPEHALAHARLTTETRSTDLAAIAKGLPPGTLPKHKAGLGIGTVNHRGNPESVGQNQAAAKTFGHAFRCRLDDPSDEGTQAYWMSAPAPQEILDALRADQPLTMVKLPHGLWDIHVAAKRIAEKLLPLPCMANFSREQTERLARRLLGTTTEKQRTLFLSSDYFIDDVLDTIADLPEEPDLLVGLAFSGYPVAYGVAEHARDLFANNDIRASMIREAFPAGREFTDGTLFKRWAISGDLSRLPSAIADRPVVFILSEIFDDLGSDLGLADHRRIAVPPMGSHALRYDILERTSAVLNDLSEKPRPPVVIAQVGGSLTFWLLMELRKRFPRATFLDVGQSINIWRMAETRRRGWLRTYFDQLVAHNDLATFYGEARLEEVRSLIEPFESAPPE